MTPQRLGPYKIERLLGQGGMGSVYLGTHAETGEQAAVKILSTALSQDEDFRARFGGEIESLKKLHHPHIVQLFGWGEEDGVLFYVMEHIDGKSLQQRLAEGERVEWREAIQIGIDVCKALKHAHDSGIIHRDLKPANLLRDPGGKVKLTDFGIAKLFGHTQLTVAGGVVGTADYMAPEQALGQAVNHRCDLYSLGTVLFTLLAGRPPFLAKTMAEVVHKVCYEPPQPVRRFNSSVPPQLESLIGELLEKDPSKRPPTARSLTRRLEAMQHGLTESKQRPSADSDKHSTDFDFSEPGETVVPREPRVHSATTQFAPSNEPRQSPADDASNGSANDLEVPSAVTQAPLSDMTSDSTPARGGRSEKATDDPQSRPARELAPSKSFTTVEEAAARSRPERGEHVAQRWIAGSLAAALMAIVAFVAWQVFVPRSANDLYAAIDAIAGDERAELSAAAPDIGRFLELYPDDPRAEEVRQLQNEMELERMQRTLERRARRLSGGAAQSPVERAYLEAVELSKLQPEAARQRFGALIDVYENQEDAPRGTRDIVELARRQMDELDARADAENAAFAGQLDERLQAAQKLEETEPEAARAMYEGIVLLYEDKPWAGSAVTSAKQRLEAMTPAE